MAVHGGLRLVAFDEMLPGESSLLTNVHGVMPYADGRPVSWSYTVLS